MFRVTFLEDEEQITKTIKKNKKEEKITKVLDSTSIIKPTQKPKPITLQEEDLFVKIAKSNNFKRLIFQILYGHEHITEKQHGNLEKKVYEVLK